MYLHLHDKAFSSKYFSIIIPIRFLFMSATIDKPFC